MPSLNDKALRAVETPLETLSRIITRNKNVLVEVGSPTLEVEGDTIKLPVVEEGLWQEIGKAVRGWLDHACGHIIHTDQESKKQAEGDGMFLGYLFNTLEDARIEKLLSEEYFGCKENLDKALDTYLEDLAEDPRWSDADEDKGVAFVGAALSLYAQIRGDEVYDFIPEKCRNLARKCQPIVGEVKSATDSSEVLEASRKAWDIISRALALEDTEPPKTSGGSSGEEQQESGGGDQDQTGQSDSSNSNSQEDRDSGQREGEESEQNQTGEKEGDKKEGEEESDGGESEKSQDESGDSKDANNENSGSEGSSDNQQDNQQGDPQNNQSGKGGSQQENRGNRDNKNSSGQKDPQNGEQEQGQPNRQSGGVSNKGGLGTDLKGVSTEDILKAQQEIQKSLAELQQESRGQEGKKVGIGLAPMDGAQGSLNESIIQGGAGATTGPKDYRSLTTEYDYEEVPEYSASDRRAIVRRLESLNRHVLCLKNKILRLLLSRKSTTWRGARSRGKIDPSRLHHVVNQTSTRVFRKRTKTDNINTACSLVLDFSGSMCSKMDLVADICLVFGEVLSKLSFPTEIIGFTLSGRPNGIYDEAKRLGKTIGDLSQLYARTEVIKYTIVKTFDERWSEAKPRLNSIGGRGGTPLGESLMYAAKRLAYRPEERRIILSLTDGWPTCNYGFDAVGYCRGVAKTIEKHMDLVGIGIACWAVKEVFSDYIVVNDINQLVEEFTRKMTEVLKRGAIIVEH